MKHEDDVIGEGELRRYKRWPYIALSACLGVPRLNEHFTGITIESNGTKHFEFYYCGFPMPACYGYLEFAWGYDGGGPRALAKHILSVYAGLDFGHARRDMANIPARDFKPGLVTGKLCQEFASEVIAELPNNWIMTMDDIEAWLKKKGAI